MPSASRQQTREQELWAAILGADLTPSDFRVYVTLLKLADFGTAEIPVQFQPRSLIKLAERCHISLAGTKRSVGHLQRHGWLERHRNITASGIGGRGHPTTYKLLAGRDCDCPKGAQREPVKLITAPSFGPALAGSPGPTEVVDGWGQSRLLWPRLAGAGGVRVPGMLLWPHRAWCSIRDIRDG